MDRIFVKSQKKGNENNGSIYARIRTQSYNVKYAIGIKISQSEWQKYKLRRYNTNSTVSGLGISFGQFALILLHVKTKIEANCKPFLIAKAIKTLVYESITKITEAALQKGEPQKNKKKNSKSELLLHDYFSCYIDDLKSGKRTKKRYSQKVSDGYIENMKSALSNLLAFEKSEECDVPLNQVGMAFQQRFVAFLRNKGLHPNTITTRMSSIRCVMHVAFLERRTRCVEFQNPEFVPARQNTDKPYLSLEKIQELMDMPIINTETMRRFMEGYVQENIKPITLNQKAIKTLAVVRDIFLLGYFTGQRVSDFMRINTSMLTTIGKSEFIKLKQVKTGKDVLIPYHVQAKAILEKYEGQLPTISKKTFSRHLRTLGNLIGFHNLTSHTARRSFATNAYASGIPLPSIMAVTGHSTEKSLRTYLRLSEKEKAVIAASDFQNFCL